MFGTPRQPDPDHFPELIPTDLTTEFLRGDLALMVDSSWLASAKYSPGKEELQIGFNSGWFQIYETISMEQARDFAMAGSKGTWMWDHIFVRGPKNADGTIPARVPNRPGRFEDRQPQLN